MRKAVVELLKDGHLRELLSDHAKANYGKEAEGVKQQQTWEPISR